MRTIGAFNAKTHFSQLLLEVEQGEKIMITKHGTGVAMLVPLDKGGAMNTTVEAIETIRRLRKGVTLGKGLSIKSLREEGRK